MNRKIKVGIWGIGRAGWIMHCAELDGYPEWFEIAAGCDVDADRVAEFAARYPAARGYTDGEAFLRDDSVEMVSIAVRSQEHVEYAFRALEAGKTVFLEKPIALHYADAVRLKEAALGAYKGKLFFRQNRRFEPAFNHIRDIISSGILGAVYEIKLCRHNFQLRDDWQTLIECGGGQLNNWGPHLIDHALRLLDAPVRDFWSNLDRVAARGDAEDHVKVIFRGENNRVIDLEISGGVLLPSPVYAVYGTRGTLISRDESELELKYLDPAQAFPDTVASPGTPARDSGYGTLAGLRWITETIPTHPANGADMNAIYGHLYRAIRENVPFPIDPEQAAMVVYYTEKIKNASRFTSSEVAR